MSAEEKYDSMHKNNISNRRTVRDKVIYAESRNYINFIKSLQYEKYVSKGDVVLDVCCGKGQDLNKFRVCKIQKYIGIDVSQNALNCCKKRLQENKHKFIWNLYKLDVRFEWIQSNNNVDIISCQLGPQYFTSTEEIFDNFIKNIAHSLKTKGKFLCMYPNAEIICQESVSSSEDKPYHIDSTQCLNKNNLGQEYLYTQKNHFDKIPEFILPQSIFIEICQKYNLELIEHAEIAKFCIGKRWEIVSIPSDYEILNGTIEFYEEIKKISNLSIGLFFEFPYSIFIPKISLDCVILLTNEMGAKPHLSPATDLQKKMRGFYPSNKQEAKIINLYSIATFEKK